MHINYSTFLGIIHFKYYKSGAHIYHTIKYKPLIQSFTLNIYYVPEIILGLEDKAANKKVIFLFCYSLPPSGGRQKTRIKPDDYR